MNPDWSRLRANGLTERECEVVFWIGQGKRDAEIAIIIGCARRTINKHVQNIIRKLGARTRLNAVYLAQELIEGANQPLPTVTGARGPDGPEDLDYGVLRTVGLTRRQCEVIAWMAQGKRDAEIATQIGLSPRTVNKHIEQVLRRLHAENRATAVHIAQNWIRNNTASMRKKDALPDMR